MRNTSQRLESLEEKLDTCLVLLRMVTTADDFTYTLSNKSEYWIKRIEKAEKVARRAADALIERHPKYGLVFESCNSSPRNTTPNERVDQEGLRLGSNQAASSLHLHEDRHEEAPCPAEG